MPILMSGCFSFGAYRVWRQPTAEHVVLEHEPIVTRLIKPITLKALQESISLALRID